MGKQQAIYNYSFFCIIHERPYKRGKAPMCAASELSRERENKNENRDNISVTFISRRVNKKIEKI